MKPQFSLLFVALALAGCSKDPVSVSMTNNASVAIAEMFTYKGCTVYRFIDDGRYHYYTDCRGQTVNPQSCGKSCIHDEEINTEVKF